MDITPYRRQAILLTIAYGLVGIAWIAASDSLLALSVQDVATLTRLQTWKGWLFIAVSATAVYLLAVRAFASQHALLEETRLREAEARAHNAQLELRVDERTADLERELDARNAAEAALHDTAESLDITLQSIGDAVLATDTTGTIVRMNPVAERLTGWPRAEAVGRPVEDVFRIVNEGTRKPVEIPVGTVPKSDELGGLAIHAVLIARDGTEHAIEDSAAPIRDNKGNLRGVVLVFRDVNRKRAAELALIASENRYRQLVNMAPFGIFVEGNGCFTFANPATVAMLGGQAESEFVGRPVLDFLHPDYHEVVEQRIGQLRSGLPVPSSEERWLRLDRSSFYAEVTAVPYEYDGHSGAMVLLKDVTARKQALAQVDRFYSISPDIFCIAGADGYFKRVNPAFAETLGWSSKELLTVPFLDLVHPDDRDATLREVELQITTGKRVQHFENRYRHKDGSWRTLSWRSIPQEDGLLFATARDVTERRNAEAAVVRLNGELQRTIEERSTAFADVQRKEMETQAILDNLLDCVITIDTNGIVQRANAALANVCGYSPAEIIGRNISMLMPEPHAGLHDTYLRNYLNTGNRRVIGTGRQVEGRHKDGHLIPMDLSVNEFFASGKRLFVGELRDISERQRFIGELTQARIVAQEASRAKSAFLAAMSHEIRTPMNGILGMAEVLAHGDLSHHQADLLATIRESAGQLLHLIDDILDFSKIEAGKLELEYIPVSIPDIVEGVASTLETFASRKEVNLRVFISPQVPQRVSGDETRLRQLIYNLLGNAIKFSSGRSDKVGQVGLRAEMQGTNPPVLRLTVSDNGIGIAPEVQEMLFMPFTQAESSTTRRFGGTGLGLAICKRIVDLMGGEISVASTVGKGSTFTTTLPLSVADQQPDWKSVPLEGITCIVTESDDYSADDIEAYLIDAGAAVQRTGIATAASMAPSLAFPSGAPVVTIRGPSDAPDSGTLPGHQVLIGPGRRHRPRLLRSGVVSIEGNVLRCSELINAVAISAGLSLPEVPAVPAESPGNTPLDIERARAADALILVAEDDPINQKVILHQLALLGYAAEVADNGAEALRLWRAGFYALLLADLHMPEMDGYELTREIRKAEKASAASNDKPAHLPILALTANALRGEESHAFAAGMDAYLTKPIALGELRAALTKWLPAFAGKTGPTTSRKATLPATAPPLIDLSLLADLIGQDEEAMHELLQDYRASARKQADDIKAAAVRHDAVHVSSIAHKLKSSSRSVGAQALGDLCANLENAAKLGDRDALLASFAEFERTHAAVDAEIGRILEGERK